MEAESHDDDIFPNAYETTSSGKQRVSMEQVLPTMKSCLFSGEESELDVLHEDVKQNCRHASFGSNTARFPSNVTSSQNPLERLQKMGFSTTDVQNASESLGSIDFDELLEYLIEHKHNDLHFNENVGNECNMVIGDESTLKRLNDMGFTSFDIEHAASICGTLDVKTLLSFLISDDNIYLHEKGDPPFDITESHDKDIFPNAYETTPSKKQRVSMEQVLPAMKSCCEESVLGILQEDVKQSCQFASSGSNTARSLSNVASAQNPLERLQRMGFSTTDVQEASELLGSIDFDELLDYLINYKHNDLHSNKNVGNEHYNMVTGDESTLKRLNNMGFTSSDIEHAASVCGTLDIEMLLSFLISDDDIYLHEKGDSPFDNCKRHTGKRESTEGFEVTSNEERHRQCISAWADTKTFRLWYSYLGLKGKIKISAVVEPEGSGDECSGVPTKERHRFRPSYIANGTCSGFPFKTKGIGFGVPGFLIGRPKPIISVMEGPPFFYFENVESTPHSEWDTIKRHFNGIDPEFTNSKYFSASTRPRGYVHNLPIEGRRLIMPLPPMTISEALPQTQKYWPSWDTREKLNCINTSRAPDSLSGLIRRIFTFHNGRDIPFTLQREIILACKRWNLVWVGPGQAAPLEPDELELILGYDRDHTRGCSTPSQRYEALGNSFQVNTVAYHLSPLKALYPHGLKVLSLFSGIGGAEVALDKLGIFLKVVVSVEINEKSQNVISSWWRKSGQHGELRQEIHDVKELTEEVLSDIIVSLGGIDLIVGGSPCNNLSGNNRVSRVGLSGKESCLFFEFPRVLNIVKQIMYVKGMK